MKKPNTASPADASEALTPADLQSAYGIGGTSGAAATKGTGETVAIVDAYGDPNIASDLEKYRSEWGLSACDAATGAGCLSVYDENGGSNLPAPNSNDLGWENEEAIDVEMVSAICPNCHIDLFEANSVNISDLGTAENTAAAKDAFVSNSWNFGQASDYPGESAADSYFDHPGVAIAFASGDNGYGAYGYEAAYPASSQSVISVGGTFLDGGGSSPWVQYVWNDLNGATGSGCSAGEAKPAWQTDIWCSHRTQNDVAAVADSPEGIAVYSTHAGGLKPFGGTSVATPIITAMYALAGKPAANTYPVSYLYRDPADLTHVTTAAPKDVEAAGTVATNGTCESSRAYLCNVTKSVSGVYNGPTGLGAPNGSLTPFTAPAGDVVSVTNPGDYALQTGVSYSLPAIQAIDSASGQALTYSQTGLPSGLSIDAATGAISGTVSSAVTGTVHVTVKDGTGASSTVSFRITAVPSLTSAYHPAPGPVTLKLGGKCLDDTANRSTAGNKIEIWTCNGLASQKWTFYPDTDPTDAVVDLGTMQIHGMCMDLVNNATANGTKVQLSTCNGGASQQWGITGGDGQLYNVAAQRCLDDTGRSTTNGTQVEVWDCNFGSNQNWQLPPSPVENGVLGKCLDDTANQSANGTKIESWDCNGMGSQRWQVYPDGTIRIHGKCLNAVGNGTTIGTRIQLYSCGSGSTTYSANYWYLTTWGQIENAQAEKCLVIPGNSSANGAPVELSDCNVQPSEIWAAS